MKIELEMINNKKYVIDYKDDFETFLQRVQFENSNGFLLTDNGTYVSITKIVDFKPLEK